MSGENLKPILIAGATASGKSALAMALAREFDGVIINSDSCQVYRELDVISARPSAEDMSLVPHRLYGHVSGAEDYSTGIWLDDVAKCLDEVRGLGLRAIFVGGTGLYFQALLEGLSEIPAIEADVRQYWREQAQKLGAPALHAILTERDPLMGAQLHPSDTQRITRALEVFEGTGQSLKHWQAERSTPLLEGVEPHCFVVSFEREVLYQRINDRFGRMVREMGGLEEVQNLLDIVLAGKISRAMPMMRALGVPELMAHLEGEIELEEALLTAQQQTRRYAKRQLTWLRRNMIAWNWLDAQQMKRLLPEIVAKIHESG